MVIASQFLASPLAKIFVGYDKELYEMTVHGFKVYVFSFIFVGAGIFGSAFFTALNAGVTSAFISFLRTLVFQITAVMLLPLAFGLDGIWYSVIVAESLAVVVTVIILFIKRKQYRYM